MKTYNSKIENGIKTALYSLEALMESESIVDSRVESIRKQLVDLLVEAQLGTIDNIDELNKAAEEMIKIE